MTECLEFDSQPGQMLVSFPPRPKLLWSPPCFLSNRVTPQLAAGQRLSHIPMLRMRGTIPPAPFTFPLCGVHLRTGTNLALYGQGWTRMTVLAKVSSNTRRIPLVFQSSVRKEEGKPLKQRSSYCHHSTAHEPYVSGTASAATLLELTCAVTKVGHSVRFEVSTAVTMKNAVFCDIKTQFVPHRRHSISPLQIPAC
jgi:hypothetical protein